MSSSWTFWECEPPRAGAVATAAGAIGVNVIRSNFTDSVTLVVDIDLQGSSPPGGTAAWEPDPVTGNGSVLPRARRSRSR
jgi:hypothetical protein